MVGTPPPIGSPPVPVQAPGRDGAVGLRRRRRRRLVVGLAGVLLALVAIVTWVAGHVPDTAATQRLDTGPRSGPAPAFALPDLADPARTVGLADFRGRPVVVNFWASWCVPCRREMPRLAAAARRLDGRVAFLGVNYKDQRPDALAFVKTTAVPYPSAVDRDGALGARYGIYGLPTTVFVDAEGRIVGRYLGEMSAATLGRFLRQLQTMSP